jgi:hypothetical protein
MATMSSKDSGLRQRKEQNVIDSGRTTVFACASNGIHRAFRRHSPSSGIAVDVHEDVPLPASAAATSPGRSRSRARDRRLVPPGDRSGRRGTTASRAPRGGGARVAPAHPGPTDAAVRAPGRGGGGPARTTRGRPGGAGGATTSPPISAYQASDCTVTTIPIGRYRTGVSWHPSHKWPPVCRFCTRVSARA